MGMLERRYRKKLASRAKVMVVKKPKQGKRSPTPPVRSKKPAGTIDLRVTSVPALVVPTQNYEDVKAALSLLVNLQVEMSSVNVNIHPLRAMVLQHWREIIADVAKRLQETVDKWEQQH